MLQFSGKDHTMKNLLLAFILVSNASFAQHAMEAQASGDDTYLLFTEKAADAGKKYTLFSLSKTNSKSAQSHEDQCRSLQDNLKAGYTVEFVKIDWLTNEDLNKRLTEYGIESAIGQGDKINLKGDNISLNTSSPNAFFLIEGKNAVLLCSGTNCQVRINDFFK
jgi:hypothetical protein